MTTFIPFGTARIRADQIEGWIVHEAIEGDGLPIPAHVEVHTISGRAYRADMTGEAFVAALLRGTRNEQVHDG